MKKFIMFSITTLTSLISIGQERIDKKPIKWEETTPLFISANGWQYSKYEGKWKSQPNCICEKVEIVYDQHFFDIQIKSIKIDNIKHYVFIQRKRGVDWEYPALGLGFRTYNKHVAYIVDSVEFSKIKNIQDTTTINLIKLTETGWYEVMYDKVNVDKYIKDAVREYFEDRKKGEEIYSSLYYNMKFKKTKSANKEVYRFLLPQENYNSISVIDFNENYFETVSLTNLITFTKIKY